MMSGKEDRKKHMKYEKQYYMPPAVSYDWVKKETVEKAPAWCSVDLRDGNQALVEPMSLDEKLELFRLLIRIGFREIEVGYPAASETEYQFCRTLIQQRLIPEGVTIQVLTNTSESEIAKTLEAVRGAERAIIHIYNSISVVQRELVLHQSAEEVKQTAVDGAVLLKQLAEQQEGSFVFEYSPESFTGAEADYALEVCNAVLDVWQPTPEQKCIINIPATVENAMPHVFASQIEYLHKNLRYRRGIQLSIHPHNDRGCAVAAAELGLLAGADRIEGTLFGNGERTGNADIITTALNMVSHGVDCGLDFSDIPQLAEVYEKVTGMHVHDRQPYAGKLVFTAFYGPHQDAITKSMAAADMKQKWSVPYLPIDPEDIGRTYDSDVIRINSQSGKGGVCYILRSNYGLSVPENMREEVGVTVKDISERAHKEMTPSVIYQIFEDKYITSKPVFQISECHFRQDNGIIADATIQHGQITQVITGIGNGRLDAVSNAIKSYFNVSYELSAYEEHSLTKGSSSKAVAYVGVMCNGRSCWGVGIDNDIIRASIEALTVAVNKIEEIQNSQFIRDKRMIAILNFIQANYINVTLESLSEQFFLSKPYLSKYIREKSGVTFGDLVKKVRMKKARTLLKTSSMTVESIALSVGYQNVEHFNRLFKKAFHMTPVQFRNKK